MPYMLEKIRTPRWLKKLIQLGNAKASHSDANKRAYRTSTYRYFWATLAVFIYFLLGSIFLDGGSGSSDNSGIFYLIVGALILGGLAAFLGPRLNEGAERLFPSGRRRQEERRKRSVHRASRPSSRSSGSSHSDESGLPPVKTDS